MILPVAHERKGEDGEDAVTMNVDITEKETEVPLTIITLDKSWSVPDHLHNGADDEEHVKTQKDFQHQHGLSHYFLNVYSSDYGQKSHFI